MPSLKDIRRRIVSIKNTQKITRAMKLVSAAKFARAVAAVIAARPYAKSFAEMQGEVLGLIKAQGLISLLAKEAPEKKSLLVIVSTDRGFCGSLNSNLFKSATRFIHRKEKDGVQINVIPWGKRARLFAQKHKMTMVNSREGVVDRISYQKARELAQELIKIFKSGDCDRIYLSYVEFKSALAQQPNVVQILPVEIGEDTESLVDDSSNIIVEPSLVQMQDRLLERSIVSQIFRVLLESAASEHGARMTAMDSATNNASEVLRKMNIQYARARQAAITKELIEITSGAEALGN
jgi:F-type H+-transporting ATPase subunit gamma